MLSTIPIRTALACVMLAGLAACTGQGSPATQPREISAYDPQGPAIERLILSEALELAQWRDLGEGRSITALDSNNHTDFGVLASLNFEATQSGVVVYLGAPALSASLYLRCDSDRESIISVETQGEKAIGLWVNVAPGLDAIGVAGTKGSFLNASEPLSVVEYGGPDHRDPRLVSKVNTDNKSRVQDLLAIDNADSSATLSWFARHSGDYDLNGEVNISDLTPIAAHLGERYVDSGSANYAVLEVVDGDQNTEINISDLTAIAANFQTTITGYNLFRTPLTSFDEVPLVSDAGRWTKVLNETDPDGPSIPYIDNGQPSRMSMTFRDDCGDGDFGWYVASTGNPGDNPAEGPESNVTTVSVTPGGPPPAGLSFEIQTPATELANVDDEFYLAVKVSGVTGLFSANVRFEYDSSLVQLLESVSAYTDHPNFLEPPLFLAVDDVLPTTAPYTQIGFNATQTQGTAVKDGGGALGYFKFKALAPGINPECFRFPQATSFIYLWGVDYGVPVATPGLGSPQNLNIAN